VPQPQHAPQQWAPQQSPPGPPPPPQWPVQQQPPPQQWPPQHQQPWPPQQAPAAVPALPGPNLGTHLKRAFDWNLAEVAPTPREQQQLAAAGVEPRLHGMMVWRRSTLLVALPLLLLTVGLGLKDAADVDTSGFTGLGKFWAYLPVIGVMLAPIGALVVILRWTEMRRTARLLIAFWVLSIAIPLVAALIPLDVIVDIDTARQKVELQGGDVRAFDAEIIGLRAVLAVGYAVNLLPVLVTIPGGVLKGAARIKSLFPAAALPGWFLVAVAPFYSLFTIVVFVLIEQIVGGGVLLLGVGLLAFGPWLYVIHRKVYGRPLSMAEAAAELPRASRLGGFFLLGGLILIAIYAFTSKVSGMHVVGSDSDTAFLTYWKALQVIAEVFARTLLTTVVFSAIVLAMIFAEWRNARTMRPDIRAEHDEQMQAIDRYMSSPSAPPPPAWATGPAPTGPATGP
jgi:hypothetical protein